MEFTKDIYFENSPTATQKTKIIYSGTLFKNGSNNVNIVYGFGEAWNNTTTKPMEKNENGFVVSVRMKNFDTFNFCFSDENNNWDNNNYFNYISPILPNIEETVIENENNLDDIIEEILGNTVKQDIITNKDNNSIDKILETINTESLPEIEELFNELFDIPNDPINFEFEEPVKPLENEKAKLNVASFNLDGLVSDLLDPVIASETSAEKGNDETSLFEDIKIHQNNEETSLTIVNPNKFSVSLRKLGYFYKIRKRIRLSILKLSKLSKKLAKQLGL